MVYSLFKSVSFQPFTGNVASNPVSQSHNSQGRIESPVIDMQASIGYEKIGNRMNSPIFISDRSFGIVSHPAGTRLVLSAA